MRFLLVAVVCAVDSWHREVRSAGLKRGRRRGNGAMKESGPSGRLHLDPSERRPQNGLPGLRYAHLIWGTPSLSPALREGAPRVP